MLICRLLGLGIDGVLVHALFPCPGYHGCDTRLTFGAGSCSSFGLLGFPFVRLRAYR